MIGNTNAKGKKYMTKSRRIAQSIHTIPENTLESCEGHRGQTHDEGIL